MGQIHNPGNGDGKQSIVICAQDFNKKEGSTCRCKVAQRVQKLYSERLFTVHIEKNDVAVESLK